MFFVYYGTIGSGTRNRTGRIALTCFRFLLSALDFLRDRSGYGVWACVKKSFLKVVCTATNALIPCIVEQEQKQSIDS